MALALSVIVLLGAYVRCAPFSTSQVDGSVSLLDGDSYYHLRRVEQTLAGGGRVPMFDPALAHPHGMPLQWHAGYDLPLAGVVALVCGAKPGRACLESTAAWSTPVLGSAGIALVYALGAEAAGPAVGLLSALLFAVHPWSAGSARLGSVDHHVLEPLLPALWLLLLARRRFVLAALACAGALSAVPSALLPILVSALAALGAQLVLRGTPLAVAALSSARPLAPIEVGKTLALTGLLAIPLVLSSPFAARFDVNGLSLLHLVVLALAAALAHAIERAMRVSLRATLCALSLALAIVLAASLALWPMLAGFSDSAGLWSEVAQLKPLATGFIGYALCVLLSLGVSAYGLLRARALDAPLLALLALLQPLLFLPGVLQMRYLMPASAPFSIMLAFALADGSAMLRRRVRREPRRTQALALLVALSVLWVSLLPATQSVRRVRAAEWLAGLVRVLHRGRELSTQYGSGAVLADWRFGHHVLYFTGLPVVASPFMWIGPSRAGRPDPNLAARRALLSPTPEHLLAALDALDCRYLLLSEPFDVALSARALGLPAPTRVAARQLLDGGLPPPGLQLLAAQPTARLYVRVTPARP